MRIPGRVLLLVAAGFSAAVALLHVAIAVFGPSWYRWFGAPALAARIEAGSVWGPVALTLAVAVIFAVWACYALSGAGALRRLPLLKTGLYVIGVIYLLRGVQLVPELIALGRGTVPARYPAFSGYSALAGVAYLLGVIATGRSGGAAPDPSRAREG